MIVSPATVEAFALVVHTVTSEHSTTTLEDAFLYLFTLIRGFLFVSPVLQVVPHANHWPFVKAA